MTRRGFTLLEFTVAMALFGIAITGLFPLVTMYSRALHTLEQRWNPVVGDWYRLSHLNPPDQFDSLERRRWGGAAADEWYTVPAPTRFDANAVESVHKWYLEPPESTWARKLGQCALITTIDHNWPAATQTSPVAAVTIHAGDASPAYSEVGNWDEQHEHGPQQGQSDHTATWTFTVPAAGWYRVQATWSPSATLTTAASYTIVCGSETVACTVNQQASPDLPAADPADEGRPWHTLTTQYFPQATSVVVTLHTVPSGSVLADGMRIVPCTVQAPSLHWSADSGVEEITACLEIKP